MIRHYWPITRGSPITRELVVVCLSSAIVTSYFGRCVGAAGRPARAPLPLPPAHPSPPDAVATLAIWVTGK